MELRHRGEPIEPGRFLGVGNLRVGCGDGEHLAPIVDELAVLATGREAVAFHFLPISVIGQPVVAEPAFLLQIFQVPATHRPILGGGLPALAATALRPPELALLAGYDFA
jgi:hypothetical protein